MRRWVRGYGTLVAVNLKLALRERIAIFFNYIFPLIFFFGFAQALRSGAGAGMTQIVAMVLVIGILGNGLFGGGIRTVQDREQNILRRFKVAPISPLPLLVASMVTGLVLYLPAVFLTIGLARLIYGMPIPERWLSLLVLVSVGVIAFRAIGLIIAAVANSAQESQILVQLVYLPMLFLTGATIPLTMLPNWAQEIAQFLPGTHLVTGLHGVMLHRDTALHHWQPLLVMFATAAVSTFISMQIFRWEKGEKLRTAAKLWLLAMVFPSLVLGAYQMSSRQQITKTRALYRDTLRSTNILFRNARIFTGTDVIENGWVLVRGGKIAASGPGDPPADDQQHVDVIPGGGRTLLPGLIDVRVELTSNGAPFAGQAPPLPETARRALAAYLFSGVTAVRNVRRLPPDLQSLRKQVDSGEVLGAELYECPSPGAAGCEPFTEQPAGHVWVPHEPYVPALAAVDGMVALFGRNDSILDRKLLTEAVPPALLHGARQLIRAAGPASQGTWRDWMPRHSESLLRAAEGGAVLVAGSGAGSPLVFHGPAIQRELALWVEAGIEPERALRAATSSAAALIGASGRMGAIRPGYEANLVLVEGNPLQDIGALERIAEVVFKGERLERRKLLLEKP